MLLQKSGFKMPVADSFDAKYAFKDVQDFTLSIKDIGQSNCLVARNKAFPKKDYFIKLQEAYQTVIGSKDLYATVDIITLTGKK